MSKLPPEVVDLIIDFCRPDHASLKACSLVCKTWFPRARHNLFHHSILHLTVRKLDEIYDSLWENRTSGDKLYYFKRIFIPSDVLFLPDSRKQLSHIVSAFRADATWLTLSWANAFDHKASIIASSIFQGSTLTTIGLLSGVFDAIQDLMALLCCFPALKRLCLQFIGFRSSSVSRTTRSEWEALGFPRGLHTIHIFDVDDHPHATTASINELFVVSGASVEDLVLVGSAKWIDLHFLSILRHLTLDIRVERSLLIQPLLTLSSPVIEEVTLILRDNWHDFSECDSMLASAASLRRLRLKVKVSVDLPDVTAKELDEYLKTRVTFEEEHVRFPKCSARGIVRGTLLEQYPVEWPDPLPF